MEGGHALGFGCEWNFLHAWIGIIQRFFLKPSLGSCYDECAFSGIAFDIPIVLFVTGFIFDDRCIRGKCGGSEQLL